MRGTTWRAQHLSRYEYTRRTKKTIPAMHDDMKRRRIRGYSAINATTAPGLANSSPAMRIRSIPRVKVVPAPMRKPFIPMPKDTTKVRAQAMPVPAISACYQSSLRRQISCEARQVNLVRNQESVSGKPGAALRLEAVTQRTGSRGPAHFGARWCRLAVRGASE
jgi:hypothetical protein